MRLSAIGQVVICFIVLSAPVAADLMLRGLSREPVDPVWSVPGGDPARGRQAIAHHGCGACHVIGGIRHAEGRVGPRLLGLREQIYVAGVLPNSPTNLANWVRVPQDINPQTAMPNLGVTEQEARDIAAYLYTQ
jgi:cytochrome c2